MAKIGDDGAPILRVVQQRHDADCCVACLAMLLGVSYEDALLASGPVLRKGMYLRQVEAAAKRLGVALRRRRRYDLESDTGLLNVVGKDHDHMVVLKDGLIFNTDGTVWDADVYLAAHKLAPRTLLVRGVESETIRDRRDP